ncbi:GntR family transcriptional regulator [Christensenellaceae bacterium OttesenSCG-928-M15]|nr:GntR family transcriptional regulator [Christensenellaceae bacterium OttesenSCG-928-M15]
MDFCSLRLNDKEPVYLQLVMYVKRCVLSGAAHDGEALLSRRELAAQLGINPNTVQKAFKIMEEEGFVATPPNAKSVIRITEEIKRAIEEELTGHFVREFVANARDNRLSYKKVIELISQYWEEDV